jgi:hypothetical protein
MRDPLFLVLKQTAADVSVREEIGTHGHAATFSFAVAMPQSSDASQIGKDKFLVESVIADANARPDDLVRESACPAACRFLALNPCTFTTLAVEGRQVPHRPDQVEMPASRGL